MCIAIFNYTVPACAAVGVQLVNPAPGSSNITVTPSLAINLTTSATPTIQPFEGGATRVVGEVGYCVIAVFWWLVWMMDV